MPKKSPRKPNRRKRWTPLRADIIAWLPLAKFIVAIGIEALRFWA